MNVHPLPQPHRNAAAAARCPRLLIFIVAYQAEATVADVLSRIPHSLAEHYDIEILVIDDGSADRTFETARATPVPFRLTVLINPVNQGYGGNQKIGYCYALRNGFDFVVLLHGDGQYAPERLPDLLRPLRNGRADACFGSRMMTKHGALEGGMPLYKLVGNKVLTWFQNRVLGTAFTEWHSGYRAYAMAAMRELPFDLNTNDFHFDTEIIVQLVLAGFRIMEVPIPTYYGDEICRVNGLKYAWNVAAAVVKARAQDLGLFYDRRFDCPKPGCEAGHYQPKLDYESPHSLAVAAIPPKSRVLDLGCAGGHVGSALKGLKGCRVTGVDCRPLDPSCRLDAFHRHDLNDGLPALQPREFDHLLLLDVIEHLASPERFVSGLREAFKLSTGVKLIVSTGNIGFIVTRLMLLIGQFNYGKRGILDLTHKRLFTLASLRRLFEQGGFRVLETRGIPAPFPLALGHGRVTRLLMGINKLLIRLSKGLFSYQIFMMLEPQPSLESLLRTAEEHSAVRAAS